MNWIQEALFYRLWEHYLHLWRIEGVCELLSRGDSCGGTASSHAWLGHDIWAKIWCQHETRSMAREGLHCFIDLWPLLQIIGDIHPVKLNQSQRKAPSLKSMPPWTVCYAEGKEQPCLLCFNHSSDGRVIPLIPSMELPSRFLLYLACLRRMEWWPAYLFLILKCALFNWPQVENKKLKNSMAC